MQLIWRKVNAITNRPSALSFGLFLSILVPDTVVARNDPALVCDQAAMRIAKEADVPLDVLRAITRTETGRGPLEDLKPWPWTVNMQGTGVWFDTMDQAQVYVFKHFKNGARSFDVGCFQINYKWHSHAFGSIEEMFDPVKNTRYAARFLKQLYAEHGEWPKAVGAYHSRTQKYAQRYLRRFVQIRSTLPASNAVRHPINDFPLLAGQSSQETAGSLFPNSGRAGVSLFRVEKGS